MGEDGVGRVFPIRGSLGVDCMHYRGHITVESPGSSLPLAWIVLYQGLLAGVEARNPGEEVGAFCLLWAQGPCARCAAAWGQPVDAWRRQAIPQPHLSTAVPHWGASMWEANGGISGGTVP